MATSNATTTVATQNNSGFSFDWGGINLLLVVIYGAIFILTVVVFVKRAILRVSSSQQKPDPGRGASKGKKNEITKKMDELIHFAYEPKLLPITGDLTDGDDNLCDKYFYRMKAVDSFSQVDAALFDANSELRRPMGKSIRQHLIDAKSHSSGCLRSIRTNQLNAFSDMYLHARCNHEQFGEDEYKKYLDLGSDIVNTLRHRTHKKKLKEKRKELQRQTALSIDSSNQEDETIASRQHSIAYETSSLIEKPNVAVTDSDVPGHSFSPAVPDSDAHPLLVTSNVKT